MGGEILALSDSEQEALGRWVIAATSGVERAFRGVVAGGARLVVPDFRILPSPGLRVEDVAAWIAQGGEGCYLAVRQSFRGPLVGDAVLLLAEAEGVDLVRSVLGVLMPHQAITELEQDVLLELGNIVLNTYLAAAARTLNWRVESGLPKYAQGDAAAILSLLQGEGERVHPHSLSLALDFILQGHVVSTFVLFLDNETQEDAEGRGDGRETDALVRLRRLAQGDTGIPQQEGAGADQQGAEVRGAR